MNERIRELALEAGLQLGTVLENYTSPVKTITVEQRKFAELIVQECGVALSPMLRDMISRGQAYDLIKEHFFGVEE